MQMLDVLIGAPPRAASIHGREAELAQIDRLLDGARAGRSGALVLHGDAGAGKSTLLEAARERAGDMCVLAAHGVESEAELPFAALHQLLLGLLPRIDALPAVQARALRGALGLEDGAGSDRFVVSVAVLALLADTAGGTPVVCLLDDAQWMDTASVETLAFVARRLDADGVAFLIAVRDTGCLDALGLPALTVAGLEPAAAAALLDERLDGAPAPDVRAWLVETTAGNPLALLELAAALSPGQRTGEEPVLAPLPVSARVERAFAARVRGLPGDTQTLLLIVAADDSGDLRTVIAAAEAVDVAAAALDRAEREALVRVRDGRLELRHPLLRSALYHGAPASLRREAHAALAAVLTGSEHADRRAWHRAAASIAPDPEVVGELEQAARRARRRGAFATAALALERAAALTSEPDRRARQLAAAGEDAWQGGAPERALALLGRAGAAGAEPLLRADIDRLRALIGVTSGTPAAAGRLAREAATRVMEIDGARALRLLSIAALAATYDCDAAAIVAIGEQAERLPIDGPGLLNHQLRGLGAYYAGDFARAAPLLREALALAEATAEGIDLLIAASVGMFLGDDRAVRELHARLVGRSRERGAVGELTWALPRLAVSDIWAGHWSSAEAGLREALEIARAQGHEVVVAYLLSELAIVAALRGEEDECRALAAESAALASARRASYIGYIANSALVTLELGLGRADEALGHAQAFAVTPGLDFWDALDRIEAAVRAGAPERAVGTLQRFADWAQTGGSAWARPVAAHCRALVAEPDEAERLFREALALHAGSGRPFERARTELAFGAFLRRTRRRKEARAHLRAALEAFEALGARLWVEHARVELRASGQTARQRDVSTLDQLTAQERQIAQRVAEGHTNREIAGQLFLSPRTIDFHLRNIFRKVDITSRIQLAQLDLDRVP